VQVPTKATHQQTREYNERLILRTLYDFGPISRAEIARRTHLTRTTVSDVVGELFGRGMVEEVGRGPSSGGKAPILLKLLGDARHVIGLDLGESQFTGALVNLRGTVSHSAELPVQGRNGDDALELVYRLVDRLVQAANGTLLGIGVGTPGVIDSRSGTIRWAVNLDWQDLPLGALLAERYGLPVNLANDSQAAALAEFAFGGDGERVQNLVAIKVGLGIGAGVLLGGQLFRGDGFGAGEIGHIGIVDDGDACRCGRFGCLETVASARAIVKRAAALAGETPRSRLHAAAIATTLTLDDVRAAFEDGDAIARHVVLSAGRYLGQVIASLIGMLDVHHVVLHGSVTAFGQPWLEAVRDEAQRRALTLLSSSVDIEISTITDNVTVLGASAMLMTSELGLSLSLAR
jgi:predicted NBD/HSP70 family sugar kinase